MKEIFVININESVKDIANQTLNLHTLNKVNYCTDVVYQIVTDRFFHGSPSLLPGWNMTAFMTPLETKTDRFFCGGNWQGVIDKINDGYLTELGITAICISSPVENVYQPFISREGIMTAYHGYWVLL